MRWKVALILPAFLAIVISGFCDNDLPFDEINKLYNKADSLLNLNNATDKTYSAALADFNRVISVLEKLPRTGDSLLFLSYMKKGILLDIQTDYDAAKNAYRNALKLKELNNSKDDSLILMTYVNVGTSYYNLNNFDSASYFLLRAESLINRFPDIEYKVRLYNTLGVLYYDNGNYLQSKNYFNQAIGIIRNKKPLDTLSAVSIETNIATSYYRLGLYDEALSIYKKILKYHVYANYIYMNMGRANTALTKYAEALACFRKVSIVQLPWVLNEIAYTQLQLKRMDSASYFLDRLQTCKDRNKLSIVDMGINASYRAELFIVQKQWIPALESLQQAIIIFSGNFNNKDIYSNPLNFAGTFAYYRLFDAVFQKAKVFESLYEQSGKEEYLLASLSTYNSTLSLLSYIEKSYDTDDAKMLLKKKSRSVYQKALSVCLALYRLHPQQNYLEQAFLISEKNRASIIIASLKERTIRNIPGIEEELLQKERNIKYNIARLDIENDQAKDAKIIESITSEKERYEIELSRLQKGFEQNNRYYRLKYEESNPGVKELQQHLSDKQALISFYNTDESLHIFMLTKSSFAYAHVDSVLVLRHYIQDWLNLLKGTENGRKFEGEKTGSFLYEHLIKPIQKIIPEKDEWIIIPDGLLCFLPFESLPANESQNTLLETTTISYQFSSRFIIDENGSAVKENDSYRVLAFAPFVKEGAHFNQPGFGFMNRLPASSDEIADLNGKKYLDSVATKSIFLREMNNYPVIHLATHAISDVNNTSGSFIAFYPEKKSLADDCLFLEELYGMNMDGVRLMIISACETGGGELVNGEGVISLSRACMYAGCSSTVNSLWKADDKATSAILKQFHIYLQKGYSKSKALRLAKLDYIHANTLHKSPDYWSHLVLIGNTDPVVKQRQFYKLGIIIFLSLGALFFVTIRGKQKTKKKSTFSTDKGF
ncbi:MAG TPA: CHAT domain-containing tetratricopeptide repeat protein [Puia sp.]|nr:CHAT domain-containing tetratricopeptide repeat protein [Puia sp.]